MDCVRCGTRLQSGQAQCSCGMHVDLPASEFYTRLENKVEQSSKDNSRRGLLIGLGFLLLFLLLEKLMDTVFLSQDYGQGFVLVVAAAIIALSLGQLVRKFLL